LVDKNQILTADRGKNEAKNKDVRIVGSVFMQLLKSLSSMEN